MKIYIRFMAFDRRFPKIFTELILPDDSDVDALLKIIEQNFGEKGPGAKEASQEFTKNVLAASNGRMLALNEKLSEGQQISLIGQIIGG